MQCGGTRKQAQRFSFVLGTEQLSWPVQPATSQPVSQSGVGWESFQISVYQPFSGSPAWKRYSCSGTPLNEIVLHTFSQFISFSLVVGWFFGPNFPESGFQLHDGCIFTITFLRQLSYTLEKSIKPGGQQWRKLYGCSVGGSVLTRFCGQVMISKANQELWDLMEFHFSFNHLCRHSSPSHRFCFGIGMILTVLCDHVTVLLHY